MRFDEDVQRFWDEVRARTGAPAESLTAVETFGDSPAMADELLALVLDGTKRATAALVEDFSASGTPLPRPGDHWIVLDGRRRPVAVLRTTEARTGLLHSVDDAFAHDEGEGDRTREDWLRGHRAYWKRQGERTGVPFDERTSQVVFERFAVVWPADRAADDDRG
jgi:uncharacterized protein YhfF